MSIRELIEAVEAGGANHGSFAEALINDDPQDDWCVQRAINAHRAYTGSVDAALALMQAVLPGWTAVEIRSRGGMSRWVAEVSRCPDEYFGGEEAEIGHADTPARALLLAILKAKEGETP